MKPIDPPKIHDAQYLGSGTTVDQLPGAALPEIAFAGKSNVGKSSLLNALVERNGLARVSKAPGRTDKVNLFDVRTEAGEIIFGDLPGYGYAARSKEQLKSWGPMIEGYLLKRTSLRALVLLVDLRRGVEDDDDELAEFWAQTNKPLIVVATKIDKLPKAHIKPALEKLRAGVKGRIIGFSSETGQGRGELWAAMLSAIRGETRP
ncbi:MAG TPA: ribosome biogenesis GTP-binding protein YihA/YsxC [Polyangiaceae bacterium]|jgi:GTP-binding protein|nr:ribosome biogenesis GTP-binding protein YihA/YsxC [Polyangiaceae bacterium]